MDEEQTTPDATSRDQVAEGQDAERQGSEGQVSEVGRLDPAEADTPISDSQSIAGNPDGESGEVQEGSIGPNARTGSDDLR